MKYLAIDYGDSKIGLSLGDSESGLAMPFKIIENGGFRKLLAEIFKIVEKEKIDKIVIGLPLNTRGKKSEQTNKTKKFADQLAEEVEQEVILHDERFSSQQAIKMRPGRRDDDLAASIMLQDYLDSIKS